MTNIIVPQLGESVSEATIAKWYKQPGDAVAKDELLVELETDKVTLEVNASTNGALENIAVNEGDTVEVGALLGTIKEGAAGKAAPVATSAPAPAAASASAPRGLDGAGPAAKKIVAEHNLNANTIPGSGKDGRITKGDALAAIQNGAAAPASVDAGPREERVKMTKLRRVIAKRLKESQNTAAILTTFNEVDMTNVMALRKQYKDDFLEKHGAKLGFMSFFTKAVIHALKEVPAVNAAIDGDDLVYKNHYDIGMAVGTEQGLVVPVVRDADRLSFAGIEAQIVDFAKRARAGKLTMDELQGGTFTITNGGVYGSLLSMPIINPPQSGILGLHKIQERPIAMNGEVKIRPMMYTALSYDHRIIDGREAVTFLVKVKDAIENPERLLLDV